MKDKEMMGTKQSRFHCRFVVITSIIGVILAMFSGMAAASMMPRDCDEYVFSALGYIIAYMIMLVLALLTEGLEKQRSDWLTLLVIITGVASLVFLIISIRHGLSYKYPLPRLILNTCFFLNIVMAVVEVLSYSFKPGSKTKKLKLE